MNLFDIFVKIGIDDKASPAMKNTQKNSETLTNKIKVMSAQFEVAQKNVDALSKEFNESVKKTGVASKETKELSKKLDDAEKEAEQAKKSLDEYNKELEETGKTASKSGFELSGFAEKLGNGLKNASKIGVSALVTIGTIATKTFADFEQLAGGAELMFGDAFGTVMDNAKNAYKTVQMSQNEYLQQVNGFATGLKTALGGNEKAAADLAHRIVQAEADIVAATGNTAENVQNAFNGIMKSNFTMLDNLQIGITPTKEGFQEVIDKVNEWNAITGKATNYQMGNLADMQSALVDYIEMVGMSGYAQNEAAGTILGSFASMKAAASDFATALIDENGDVDGSFNKLKETAFTFFDNLKPRIMAFLEAISPIATTVAGITGAFVAFKAAASISTLLSTLISLWNAYKVANEGATIAQWLMNAAMNANPIVLVVTLISGLVAAIIVLWNTNEDFRNAVISAWGKIKEAAYSVFNEIAMIFTDTIPNAFQNMIDIISDGIKRLSSAALQWGKDLIQNFISGITAKWESLKGAVSSVAQTVKDFLGFSEPKKGPLSDFHTYAPDMMELFASGITDNEKLVKSAFEKSLNFGTASVDFASSGIGMSSAGIINSTATDRYINSNFPSSIELRLSSSDGQTFGRWLVPFVRSENRSNPEVVSDI